ncbi:unnamed protein product [Kluyveromyces dobzhanskii CBS 2104]|uniref:Sorting nexin MVP1 n=1 Tax=Kluyveromyces dobzhanskii CBS 2104 TaxID=1427455 RepID=A0A0A8L269_9SACH|nr:unnamed protein product [Kluyveromyces dobzhanskii CBS 2104]
MDLEADPWRTASQENVSDLNASIWEPITSPPNVLKSYTTDSLQQEANKRVNDDYIGVNIFGHGNDNGKISTTNQYQSDSMWDRPGVGGSISNTGVQDMRHFQATDTPQYAANDDYKNWVEAVRKTYYLMAEDIVSVEEIPEREGLVFKHTNYLVKHLTPLPNTDPSDDRTVVRRYSDFDWLQDVLLKRYPFRMVPELPPKRIGSQNADPLFLAKRRKGLSRFINLVMKHPSLKNDDLVLTFLTVPTDLSSWRKQGHYDTTDEFADKRISSTFMKLWRKEFSDQWNTANEKIDDALDTWVKVTVLIERNEKRMKQIAHERNLLGSIIGTIPQATNALYPQSTSTVSQINEGAGLIVEHLDACASVIEGEYNEVDNSLSIRFKAFIDILIAFKGLFERYKMMAGNNIPQLQRRVEINQERLNTLESNPDVKGTEYDRVKQSISRDKRSILEQMNRSWLIRECILEEFTIFQESQFLITDCFQRWIEISLRYTNRNVDNWETIHKKLADMPLQRR